MGVRAKETRTRSLVKAVVWRVIATLGTWLTVYIFTGDVWGSFNGTMAAAILGTIGYYINERVWNRIHWGRHLH